MAYNDDWWYRMLASGPQATLPYIEYDMDKGWQPNKAINDPKSVDDTLKIIDKALTDLRKIRFALDCARSEIRALSGRIYDET